MNTKLEKFIETCIAKGEAEESGNLVESKDGEYYETINSIYLYLKENNRLDELFTLHDHENQYVRLWSASYCLQFPNSKAEEVLEELANLKALIGFTATMTLQEWRKGNLKF